MENAGTIGMNIRKYRQRKGLIQEELAELADISTNYLGAIERGEKIPALDTLVSIINVLEVSSDAILCGVTKSGYMVIASEFSEKISKLTSKDQKRIFELIEVEIRHSTQNKP